MNEPLSPDRLSALREAIDELQPSPALGRRLRTSLAERAGSAAPRRSGGFPRAMLLATAAAAVGIAIGWWLHPRSDDPSRAAPQVVTPSPIAVPPATPPPEFAEVASPRCVIDVDGDQPIQIAAECQVQIPSLGLKLDAWAPTTVRRTANGLAMDRGLAAFSVEHVPRDQPPIEVDVGPAIVRVIGTRFVIETNGRTGHLDLLDGKVELVQDEGVMDVEAGRRVSFGASTSAAPDDPSEPREPVEPVGAGNDRAIERPEPTRDADAARRLTEALEQVAHLRRQRDYAGALARLDDIDPGDHDRATRAVLSYERGTLLEASDRTEDACTHWARHQRRFSQAGPADVAERRQRLGCK